MMAETIVALLSKLAQKGCAVIVSIHQPSSAVYQLFTHVHLLNHGHTVYSGKAAAAEAFFASIGHPLPPNFNPPDQ